MKPFCGFISTSSSDSAVCETGTPVHHAFAAIDEALLVKLDEDLLHAARILRVHREPFARPIARAAELLELLDDDAAVLFLPGPDALEEFLAAEVVLGFLLLLLQRLFDLHLRGDAGVVGAGQPEDFLAVHARLAAEDVLDGVVEHVPHVEHAGDVRRRDDDGVRRALVAHARRVGGEATLLQPEVIPFVLDGLRFVGFGNFRSCKETLTTDGHRLTRMRCKGRSAPIPGARVLKFKINPTRSFVMRKIVQHLSDVHASVMRSMTLASTITVAKRDQIGHDNLDQPARPSKQDRGYLRCWSNATAVQLEHAPSERVLVNLLDS